MIRYVLAVALTVALLAVGWAGLHQAAAVRSEQQVENQLARIDGAAASLVENDDAPPEGQPPPRRVLELRLPRDSLTSEPVQKLQIRPGLGNVSVAEYTFDGRASHSLLMEAPIRSVGPTPVTDLSGRTGTITVVLSLRQDLDGEYVELRVPPV